MNAKIQGFVDVPEEDREAFAKALPLHTKLTHAEPGCMRFTVIPDEAIPGRYHVDECFVDQTALSAHAERTSKTVWAHVTRNIKRHYTTKP